MPGKVSCNKDEKYEEACVLKCFFIFIFCKSRKMLCALVLFLIKINVHETFYKAFKPREQFAHAFKHRHVESGKHVRKRHG